MSDRSCIKAEGRGRGGAREGDDDDAAERLSRQLRTEEGAPPKREERK